MAPNTLPRLGLVFSMREQSMGVSDIAANIETAITMVIIQPNCLNIIPETPSKKVSGKNTANSTNVVAIMDSETSLVAKMAADLGLVPRSIWVVIFSKTTIASSTTIPMAILSDDNEIIFKLLPVIAR